MRDAAAIPVLIPVLEDLQEDVMVRHEAAEALGALGDASVLPVLQRFLEDEAEEVRQTCELAIRRVEWELANPDQAMENVKRLADGCVVLPCVCLHFFLFVWRYVVVERRVCVWESSSTSVRC